MEKLIILKINFFLENNPFVNVKTDPRLCYSYMFLCSHEKRVVYVSGGSCTCGFSQGWGTPSGSHPQVASSREPTHRGTSLKILSL